MCEVTESTRIEYDQRRSILCLISHSQSSKSQNDRTRTLSVHSLLVGPDRPTVEDRRPHQSSSATAIPLSSSAHKSSSSSSSCPGPRNPKRPRNPGPPPGRVPRFRPSARGEELNDPTGHRLEPVYSIQGPQHRWAGSPEHEHRWTTSETTHQSFPSFAPSCHLPADRSYPAFGLPSLSRGPLGPLKTWSRDTPSNRRPAGPSGFPGRFWAPSMLKGSCKLGPHFDCLKPAISDPTNGWTAH